MEWKSCILVFFFLWLVFVGGSHRSAEAGAQQPVSGASARQVHSEQAGTQLSIPDARTQQTLVLEEDFESVNGFRHPGWSGDLGDFVFARENGRSLLRLAAEPEKTTTQISVPLEISHGRWEFWFRQDFTASNFNRSFIFLLADRADLDYLSGSPVSGYAIQAGENGEPKQLRLIRFDRGNREVLLSSDTPLTSGTGYHVTVTRNHNGEWRLSASASTGQTSPLPAGPVVTDTTYSGPGYFGLLLRFTPSNSDRFFFDSFRLLSTPPPLSVESVVTRSPTSLEIRFNRSIDPNSLLPGSFSLERHPSPVRMHLIDERTVQLSWSEPLEGGYDTLTVTGIQDTHQSGSVTVHRHEIFIASPPGPGDLVINEILFEPLGEEPESHGGQSEYIELYNRRPHALSLVGIHLREQEIFTSDVTIMEPSDEGSLWIPANGFALLYPESDIKAFTESRISRFFNLPEQKDFTTLRFNRSTLGLRRSGKAVLLSDSSGTVLDRVDYRPQWHNPNRVATRGIALERIDPGSASSDPSNWSSSAHPAGGTPGAANSLLQEPGQIPADAGVTLTPNPFSPDDDGHEDHLFINYRLDEPDYMIRARIFDRYGRLVRNLADSHPAGTRGRLIWDGRTDSGRRNRIGIYILLLEAYNSATGSNRTFRKTVVIARPLH